MAKKGERFIKVLDEGSAFGWQRTVFVDRQTGVNYLWIASGYGGGLTPLLNADGRPVVTGIPAAPRTPSPPSRHPAGR